MSPYPQLKLPLRLHRYSNSNLFLRPSGKGGGSRTPGFFGLWGRGLLWVGRGSSDGEKKYSEPGCRGGSAPP